ncbi:MAG: 50S ribosomal protein L18 [Flavobacteriales bacterium]|nr:50S ribosomal protein L18 [Flavobacteriales bacterium]
MALNKEERRLRIKKRSRKSVQGTAETPRLAVFRSNKEFYAQLIDDSNGKTILSSSSLKNKDAKGTKIEQAITVGKSIAELSKASGFETVKFDRNGYLYHGRVKAFAEAAREGGLKF